MVFQRPLFEDRTIQDSDGIILFQNEHIRFGEAASSEAGAAPYSEHWNKVHGMSYWS